MLASQCPISLRGVQTHPTDLKSCEDTQTSKVARRKGNGGERKTRKREEAKDDSCLHGAEHHGKHTPNSVDIAAYVPLTDVMHVCVINA